MPRTKPSSPKPPRRSQSAEKGYTQISLLLPRFYVDVLEREADFLGQRRSQLLEFLVMRKVGRIQAQRVANAPTYDAKKAKLDDVERFVWHCPEPIKKEFDNLRLRMGNIPPKTWIILALNEWIGLPSGMADLASDSR